MSKTKDYNAFGIVRIAACAADLVSMITNGSEAELKDSIAKIYETTRHEFPSGPLALRDDLNRMCSDFDLPLIIGAKQKDSGKIL
jgi:hypothetical protein